MATIIIKRKSSWIGYAQNHEVYIQNKYVGKLKSGGVLRIKAEVGTYFLSFCSTMKRLGTNATFQVVVNDSNEVVKIKTKFGWKGYEVKYADNKIHRSSYKNGTIQVQNQGAARLSTSENIYSDVTARLNNFDDLDGTEFENWCAILLENNGFIDVRITKTSGDQGVDILAQKDDIKYAIQCKCYSGNLGNSPVQEVHAGKSLYNCHVGVVMTNRNFTSGAKELAKATGVLLWDREKLLQMMSNI
jgi:hypothetical protein